MKVRDSDVLAWVLGQRKISQVLDVFGLLDFTFETYEPFIYQIFQFFFGPRQTADN
jgi:hypothetical protein